MASRMTTVLSTVTDHVDQGNRSAGQTEPVLPKTPSFLEPDDDDWPTRSKKQGGLALGASLTAAFVGGALVFENLANADELQANEQAGDAAIEAELLMPLDASEHDADTPPSGQARAGQSNTTTDVSAAHGGDIAPAAASGDESLITHAAAPAGPEVVTTGGEVEDAPLGEQAPDGGSPPALNFFSVNFEDAADVETEVDPFVQNNVLSRNTIIGTPGDDVLEGTEGHDKIIGASGDDVIFGKGGSDILNGNDGDDELHGGAGKDQLFGGSGNDFLEGGDDDDLDILNGGSGDDVLVVDGQNDLALERLNDRGDDLQIVRDGYAAEKGTSVEGTTFIFADSVGESLPDGVAADTQSMSRGIENLTFEGGVDYDVVADRTDNRLTGNNGDNVIYARGGDDTLVGGAGNDQLYGGDGLDDLSGGTGNDRLDGGLGDDVMRGGAGDDVLVDGLGKDQLYGEAGNDSYVLGLNDGAIDEIFDHEGANRLVLDGVGEETIEASLLGNDLYITADQTPIAMVSDYIGHESSLVGIDFGQGLKSVSSLLVDNPDLASTIADVEAREAETAANDPFTRHDHLSEPTKIGTSAADRPLVGTDGDDWLTGLAGEDHLYGGEGNDVLEGGDGRDQLKGGGGDDRYLFKAGESGGDRIYDNEGRNIAELEGFRDDTLEAALLGDDLGVFANGSLTFVVNDFVGNEEAFLGVESGNRFYSTDDLLA